MPRHFLRDDDLSPAEQAEVLALLRAEANGEVAATGFGPVEEDERVVVYAGGSSIEDMGFRRTLDLRTDVVHEPGRSGYRLERFMTNTQGHAHHLLTDRQKRAAFQDGWRLTANMRPEAISTVIPRAATALIAVVLREESL